MLGPISTPRQSSKEFRYRDKRNHRTPKVPVEQSFIAWDGEGVNVRGPNQKQSYVLFGCSTGERVRADAHDNYHHLVSRRLLDFIIDVGQRNPGAVHVGFAFGYDSNMLIQSLPETVLRTLHAKGHCVLRYPEENVRYYLEVRAGKWFRVMRENEHGKFTVTIDDVFSFFGTSFIKAYESLIGPVPEIIHSGKAGRKDFTLDELDIIEQYWQVEIDMLRQLAEGLRDNLWSAGLTVTRWYGPGALATFVLKREHVDAHMAEQPKEIREAAQYAYAGGRFELFQLGRIIRPGGIFAVDINSAYPYAIAQLPSLMAGGRWERIPPGAGPAARDEFGVYFVRLHPAGSMDFFDRPGPLFHRDKMGYMSFPWKLEGWYWAPEVWEAIHNDLSGVGQLEVMEGWRWIPATDVKPYAWVNAEYAQRMAWKSAGNPSQFAAKVMLNSLYGKMAQRVGWDQEGMRPPKWHQLEWAGWVTSLTRASLYAAISRCSPGSVISCETDSIFTTDPSVTSTVSIGDELGEWGLDVYDEIIYLQSGLAWLRKGEHWTTKRRGLDAEAFTLDSCRDYARSLLPRRQWEPYRGDSTRFIGLGAAIAGRAPTKTRHCVWYTARREINVGDVGKRFHLANNCQACRRGRTAYQDMHRLSIRSAAFGDRRSYPHPLPWEPTTWKTDPANLGDECNS